MRDTEVFASLLGLTAEWQVSSVELQLEDQSIQVRVEHCGRASCPECGKVCPLHDHSSERIWRHLDTMQFKTLVRCRVPRVDCPEHGVKQVSVPWAGVKSRLTIMFEAFVIELLLVTKCQARTARILRVSPNRVFKVMHRAVKRGLALRSLENIAHLSLDEKSFHRGHVYATVLVDVLGRRVLDTALGKDEATARDLLESVPCKEAVKSLSMDMLPAYRRAAAALPNADVIHDRFHISGNLGKAVESVRRSEQRTEPQLKGSRYVWLKNPENLSEKQEAMFKSLMKLELRTAQAYAFRQVFRSFFEHDDVKEAEKFFDNWCAEVLKARMAPFTKVVKMLRRCLPGLLNYVKHKLTNGYAECINSLIQEIKTVARGFRTFYNFKIAILFFLGKLELNPCKSP